MRSIESKFEELNNFYTREGHLNPIVNTREYLLISQIRQDIKKGKVPDEYRAELKKIGFIEDKNEEAWKNNIRILTEYINSLGAEELGSPTKCPKNIYEFYTRVRRNHQKGTLTENRIKDFLKTGATFKRKDVVDISGKHFGSLTVLNKTTDSDASGSLYYRCLCKCGNETQATKFSLESKRKKSCGRCENSKAKYILSDYVGKKIGKMTILNKPEERVNGKRAWTTRCECGNIQVVTLNNLITQSSSLVEELNCGCVNTETAKKVAETMRKNSYKNKDRSTVAKTKKKRKTNKSGYIGVHLVSERVIKNGTFLDSFYQAKIKHDNRTVTIGKYGNDKKSLLHGAIDRDLYIIEHGLEHTRNFTDSELLEKIYLFETDRKSFIIKKSTQDFIKILSRDN